jgi:AcrR family transcriptional regulator
MADPSADTDPATHVASTARTARDRARQEITAEILSTARRHLATDGAAGVSLRAVARELGFASSAVYRYVPSREELLTELLISSYDDLGGTAEDAAAASADLPPARRWVTVAATIRTWAVDHPHEWALLYGSPVPGYQAPERTIGPGIRASLALLGVLRDAAQDGWRPPSTEVDHELGADLAALGVILGLPDELDPGSLVAIVAAWTQTFGLVSFEVFGQTVRMVGSDEMLFEAAARATATALGLEDVDRRRGDSAPSDP